MTGAIALTLLLRAEAGDLPKIAEILFGSNLFAALGWSLAAIILISSIFLVRFMVKRHDKELKRVCKERDELQKILLKISQ